MSERYLNISTHIITSIMNGLCRHSSKEDALIRLDGLRTKYTPRRLEKEEEPRIDYDIFWIFDYELTLSEVEDGYMGNYARIEYDHSGHEHHLVISKLFVDLKFHPRKKRQDHPMPNMGHPLIRKVKNKGREYKRTLEEAKKELVDLSIKYPESSVLTNVDKLYILIFSRKEDPKNPVQKWIMRIAMDENDRPYIWMEKNYFEKTIKKPTEDDIKVDTKDREDTFSNILLIPEEQKECHQAISRAFLTGFRDYDYRRLYRLRQLEESDHNVFFHFTSLRSFEAILESRRLWMTDLRYMNDISELNHGWSNILESFNKHAEILDNSSAVNRILERLDGPKALRTKVFGFSFCEREELVNQWYAYGDNGTGIAMGFDVLPFLNSETAFLSRIHYNRTRKIEKIQHIISALTQSKNISDDYLDYSARGFNLLSAFLKHHAYYAETEWRLACLENPDIELSYRDSENIKSIPYYSFSFSDLCNATFEDILKVVIVGPLAERSVHRSVRAQLDRLGFSKTEVKTSELPMATN